MTINIVVTSKPVDGLLYYSYEYCYYLNKAGIDSKMIIFCHRNFIKEHYIKSLQSKYTCVKDVYFDILPNDTDITLIMGRSMMTLAFKDFKSYTLHQQVCLKSVFSRNLISVYSENHPVEYLLALKFFSPKRILDLCDTEVYPNGIGEHFEKIVYFDIHKPYKNDVKFEYLFLGTNDRYYASVEKILDQYLNYGILTYNADYVNTNRNNILVPVENLMGMFNTYVYVKSTFDPAPRMIQECKYFNKKIIYARDRNIVDGGSIYYNRQIKKINIIPIVQATEKFK